MDLDLSDTTLKGLQKSDDISEAADIVTSTYGSMAGDEILVRALIAHRDADIKSTLFWISTYKKVFADKLKGDQLG